MWKFDTSSKEKNENDKNEFYDNKHQQQQQQKCQGSIRKHYVTSPHWPLLHIKAQPLIQNLIVSKCITK